MVSVSNDRFGSTRIHHLMIMVSSVSLSPGKGAGSGAAPQIMALPGMLERMRVGFSC